jgi:hypothetical protein
VTDLAHELERLLALLLGPGAPEMQCGECFDGLDTFVEAEHAGFPPERVLPDLREHLRGCAACREEYESLRDLTRTKIRIAHP